MKIKHLDEVIDYYGKELESLFIYKTSGIQGSAAVSFIGKADVSLEHMVDQEDVIKKEHIYSDKMLHFLVEVFNNNLEEAIYRQRLYITIMKDFLPASILRQGDDLYLDDQKLSVSIATISPVSTLIHIGLNISSANTPVKTIGLEDLQIDPVKFAKDVLNQIQKEEEEITNARCKVRGVS